MRQSISFRVLLLIGLLMQTLCSRIEAKEIQLVFEASKVRFSQLESGSLQLDSGGVRIAVSKNDNDDYKRNEYRWYQYQRWTFTSPYLIKKIVFSKENVDGNKGVKCEGIRSVNNNNKYTDLKYGGQNPNYTATWTNTSGVRSVVFENTSNAVWLGKITITLEGEEPILDGTSTEVVNTDVIKSFDGYRLLNVKLSRKFVADGGWYTLCLPFYRTMNQMKKAFGDEVKVYEFSNATKNADHTVQMEFTPFSGQYPIENGKPYLIQPSKDTDDEIIFDRVNVHNVTPNIVEYDGVRFVGTYDPMAFPSDDGKNYAFLKGKDGLDLALDNRTGGKIKGTRAYFVLPSGAYAVGSVVLSETDGVEASRLNGSNTSVDGFYYTLTGLRIQGNPTAPGVYIHSGHKIVVH